MYGPAFLDAGPDGEVGFPAYGVPFLPPDQDDDEDE